MVKNYEIDETKNFFVEEWKTKYETDLRARLLQFSIDVIRFLASLPLNCEYDVLRTQLSKSATSIGANYEESQYSTYREFVARIRIVMREAAETQYWFKIIEGMQIGDPLVREKLINEINEIVRIFGSILSKIDHRTHHENLKST